MIQFNNSRTALLLLVATLTSGAAQELFAQPVPPGNTDSGTLSSTQEGSQEEGAESATTEKVESPNTTEASQPNNSPYDYQSSEEISEDRSVSFPVDI